MALGRQTPGDLQNSVYRVWLLKIKETAVASAGAVFIFIDGKILFHRLDTGIFWGYTGDEWGKVVKSRTTRFLGQYEHSLDGKNRLFLPSLFREKNKGPDFIMTQGLENCL